MNKDLSKEFKSLTLKAHSDTNGNHSPKKHYRF